MVQIIQEKSFGSDFGKALGSGLGAGVSQGLEERATNKKKMADLAKENKEIFDATGIQLRGTTEATRKIEFSEALKERNRQQKIGEDLNANRKTNTALENERGLEAGSLSGFENDPSMAEQVTRPAKEPKKTEASQPIDPEQLKIIQGVRQTPEYQKADPFTKYQILTDRGVSVRNAEAESKIAVEQRKSDPEYQRQEQLTKAQVTADITYDSELQNRIKKTVLKDESLDRIEKIVRKGVTGKPIDQILESAGLISKTSEGRRELAAELKNQYTDFKEIAGSQLSAMEFSILSGAYPNPNFSEEANLAIVKNLKIVSGTLKKEYEIAQRLKKENGGKIPEGLQSKVNNELFDYIASQKYEMKQNLQKIMNEQYKVPKGKVLMFINGNPEDPIVVSPDEIEHYEGLGASIP